MDAFIANRPPTTVVYPIPIYFYQPPDTDQPRYLDFQSEYRPPADPISELISLLMPQPEEPQPEEPQPEEPQPEEPPPRPKKPKPKPKSKTRY